MARKGAAAAVGMVAALIAASCGFQLESSEEPAGSDAGGSGSIPRPAEPTERDASVTPDAAQSRPDAGSAPVDSGDADALPDAPPPQPVCSPREARGKFCGAADTVSPVTCRAARDATNYDSVWLPSAAITGDVYFDEPIEPAPFTLEVKSVFAEEGPRKGVLAVFVGGNPAATGTLCERLAALQPGQLAVVYWPTGSSSTELRVITAAEGCAAPFWSGSDPSSNVSRDLTVHYDGNVVRAEATQATPVEVPMQLSGSLRVGVVAEDAGTSNGDSEEVRIGAITLSCPALP